MEGCFCESKCNKICCGCIPKDTLFISEPSNKMKITLQLGYPVPLVYKMKTEPLIDNSWPSVLSTGLHKAWEHQLFTDVVINTLDEVIHAHKVVLASASPYFSAMLNGSLLEGLTQTLVLKDIPGELIKVVLSYIYSGQAHLTESNVQEVLTLADYFQIHALRKVCCFYLSNTLTTENCLCVYELAKLHGCHDLASSSLHFATSKCSRVISLPSFLTVKPETILTLFDQQYLGVDSEEELLQAAVDWFSECPSSREEYLSKLFARIRLELISPEFLLKYFETLRERDLFTNEIQKLLAPFTPEKSISYKERIRSDHLEEVILVMAGESNGRVMRNIECFKMGLCSWQCTLPRVALRTENQIDNSLVLPCMNDARAYCAVASLNNHIYVIGGQTNNSFLNTVEHYSMRRNKWEKLCPLPQAIHGTAAAFLDGSLYVAGGKTTYKHENKLWMYDSDRNVWVSRQGMLHARVHHGLAALHGSLYAVGGAAPCGVNHQVYTSCEKYDPGSDSWMPIASLSKARSYLGVAVMNDYLYAVGGYDGSYWLNSVERYDPFQDQWTSVSSMVSPRSSFGITVSSGRIYCIGGYSGDSNLNSVEKYNPVTDTWHCVQSMQLRRYGGVAATVLVPFLPKPNP